MYCPTGNGVMDGRLPSPVGPTACSRSTRQAVHSRGSTRCRARAIIATAISTLMSAPRLPCSTSAPGASSASAARTARFMLDADTLAPIKWRQLLPTYTDGTQIPTVDPHPSESQANNNGRIRVSPTGPRISTTPRTIPASTARRRPIPAAARFSSASAVTIITPSPPASTPRIRRSSARSTTIRSPTLGRSIPAIRRVTPRRNRRFTPTPPIRAELASSRQRRGVHGDDFRLALRLLGRRRHDAVRGQARRAPAASTAAMATAWARRCAEIMSSPARWCSAATAGCCAFMGSRATGARQQYDHALTRCR